MCAWSSVLSTSIHVLAEATKVQPKPWKPKTESNFSAWHNLVDEVCAAPGTEVWKWESSGCNCSKLRAPHVGWCGGCSASALALTKEGGCGWKLCHTFICLHSSLAALVPWDSAAQSGQQRAGDAQRVQHSKGKQKRSHAASQETWAAPTIS